MLIKWFPIQKLANEHAEKNAEKVLIAEDVLKRGKIVKRFASFKDTPDFWDKIKSNMNKNYYIVIPPNVPICLFADIEWTKPWKTEEEVLRMVLNLFIDKCEEYDEDISENDFDISMASNVKKGSLHIGTKKIVFKNMENQHNFFMNIKKSLDDSFFDNKSNSVIDFCVYTKNRQYRLPYSCKLTLSGEYVRPLIPMVFSDKDLLLERYNETDQFDITDWTIIDVPQNSKLIECKFDKGDEKPQNSKLIECKFDKKTPKNKKLTRLFSKNVTEIQTIVDDLNLGITVLSIENNLVKCRNNGSVRRCIINGEENESDNCFLMIKNNFLEYGCFDEKCKGLTKQIYEFDPPAGAAGPCSGTPLGSLDISNQAFAQRFIEEWRHDLKYSKKCNILYLYNHVALLHEEIDFPCLTTMFLGLMKKITSDITDQAVVSSCLSKAKNTSYQNACLTQVKNYILLGAQDQFIQDNFDQIKNLFPFGNQVINLKTGEVRLRTREDYFTKTTTNNYIPNYDKDFVNASLSTLFGGNQNVVNDWKRIMGYCLTGENNLKKIFLMVGPKGNNGKSVEIKKLQQILGFLSVKANERLFKTSVESVHNTELFSLIGKRVAHITELKEGDKFNESLLKAISGDDRDFSARRAGSPITHEIIIQSKLILGTNDVPHFTVGAMANRLIVIPFNQVFEQDPDIEDLIMSHRNDFFSCYCDEAVEFYKTDRKIIFSQDVLLATATLKKERDTFLSFMTENYDLSAMDTDRVKKTDLYSEYICSLDDGIKLSRNKFYERCENELKLEIYRKTDFKRIKKN